MIGSDDNNSKKYYNYNKVIVPNIDRLVLNMNPHVILNAVAP